MQTFVKLAAMAFAAVPGLASAQTMFKCVQGNAVTYSNTSCDKLGLQSAGQVQDRVTTMPLGPTQVKGTATPAVSTGRLPSAAGKENEIGMPKAATVKPVNPLVEKLAK